MKKLIFIFTILLSGSINLVAAGAIDNSYFWKKGNEFYRSKLYDSAVFYYEQIAAKRPINADVYYNLGNTYYKLNKIGMAVLNYERALKINPEYKEAKENLLLTQTRIGNKVTAINDIFFIIWWNSITRADRAGFWAIAAAFIFIITIARLLLKRFNNSVGLQLPVQLPFITGFIWVCVFIIALVAANKRMQANEAVIMLNDAPLMNNELVGKPLLLIPEGTKVVILDNKTNWVEIKLPDGSIGWVQHSIIEKI